VIFFSIFGIIIFKPSIRRQERKTCNHVPLCHNSPHSILDEYPVVLIHHPVARNYVGSIRFEWISSNRSGFSIAYGNWNFWTPMKKVIDAGSVCLLIKTQYHTSIVIRQRLIRR
jgi:hypothetical protein